MANEIRAYSLESTLDCASARKIIADNSYTDYESFMEAFAIDQKCSFEAYNAKFPDDPVVATMNVDTSGGNPKILFNTIRLKQAEKVADITKVMISLGAVVEFGGDPGLVTVVSAMGNYTVDAFLDAAKKNNPLIIFLPQYVPTLKIGKDVFKTIIQGKADDKVEAVVQDIIDYAKDNPSVLLSGVAGGPIIGAMKVIAPRRVEVVLKKAENVAIDAATAPVEVVKDVIEGGVREVIKIFK